MRTQTVTLFALFALFALIGCSSPPDVVGDFADAQATVDAATATIDAAVPTDAPSAAVDASPQAIDAAIALACTLEEITPIAQCAYENCLGGIGLDAGVDTTQIATCIATNCFAELLSLSPGCLQCITSGVGGDLTSLLGQCTGLALP